MCFLWKFVFICNNFLCVSCLELLAKCLFKKYFVFYMSLDGVEKKIMKKLYDFLANFYLLYRSYFV